MYIAFSNRAPVKLEKILISRCLLGQNVRHNGRHLDISPVIARWLAEGRVIGVCPEVEGGLPVPREPAEIINGSGPDVIIQKGRVTTHTGNDVTEAFLQGARYALHMAQTHKIRIAVLKSRSPSCGNREIYSGSFDGRLVHGQGVTAALLGQSGIQVFNETELSAAEQLLTRLEQNRQPCNK